MPANTTHWNDLTAFDHCEPGVLAFRALVALLDTWPGDDQGAAIDFAEKLLSDWPDSARMAPWSWCKAASKGAVMPTWKLVRAIQLKCNHLGKGSVSLARLAHHAHLSHITELTIPTYTDFADLSFVYHRPETFASLKKLVAADKFQDGDVRALAESPLWQTLESFEIERLTNSLAHVGEASRIVPQLGGANQIRHLTLRSPDLIAVWDANHLPRLQSVGVFIRSVDEALQLADREELSQLSSLSIAFRGGFSGSSPFEPFLGNVIEVDEAAADAFFNHANLDHLEKLEIFGYSMGYWGREGMGRLGLDTLIASGLLHRVKHLRLNLLPLGDQGVEALAPALGKQLETLELVDVYCKGAGAAALVDSPCLSSLRCLDLSANRIDAEQVVRLSNVDMPYLQTLDLSGPGVNPYYWCVGQQPILDSGAVAWANSANARQLKFLRLSNCFLTDEALSAVFQSKQLSHLEELDLSHNPFTAAAISQSVVVSPRWQTLRELALINCRLDNEAIQMLSRVTLAPKLRSLHLAYNSIGPKGAAALASWSALANVWLLELHDNLIGDEGLMALAKSPNLGRLLELDLEQDCWNSRAFSFKNQAATALAESQSLPHLDCLFSGCVDEYHGAAYSPGFTKDGLNAVRKSEWMRPAVKAACSDFSKIHDYIERGEFNEDTPLDESDFRGYPLKLDEREAEPGERQLQQIRSPSGKLEPIVRVEPPKISPLDSEFGDADIIEGIEFRNPTHMPDRSLNLKLALEDKQRPLCNQAGKWLSDTVQSILNALSLGHFESTSSGSRQAENGEIIFTDMSFSLGVNGDPAAAVELVRECCWWVGAPEDTDFDDYPLDLGVGPERTASRFVQLAIPKIVRWVMNGAPGHRFDRVAFSAVQRDHIQRILSESNAAATADGWLEVKTCDDGRIQVGAKYLSDSAEFDVLNILVEEASLETSALIYRLMQECSLMLMPMAFVATEAIAKEIDCDWPPVEMISSPRELHNLLDRGPFRWWSEKGQ